MKLSVLMPAYNEAATLAAAVKRVRSVDFPCDMELVVVDDGSTDGTRDIVAGLEAPVITRRHEVNQGKGAAIRTAAAVATGDLAVIFDADLEYSPEDLLPMLHVLPDGEASVVFGTRTFGGASAYSFTYVMGNRLTTLAANVLFNSYITDMHCCLKLMPLSLMRELRVTSNGFGADTEITAKLLARGIRPYEVPVSYRARTHDEGKKVTWRDGVESLLILARTRAHGLHRIS